MNSELRLRRMLPPYRDFEPFQPGHNQPPGTVIAISLTNEIENSYLRDSAREILRNSPSVSLIGVLAGAASGLTATLDVAAKASDAHLPILPSEALPVEQALRTLLTRRSGLDRSFKHWIGIALPGVDERLIALFGTMLEALQHAGEDHSHRRVLGGWTVDRMSAVSGVNARALRSLSARAGLPAPGRWRNFCQLLVDGLIIQRRSEVPLTRLAIELGYTDSAALAHAYHDTFGITPSFVRERLGWTWLAWKWIQTGGSGSAS